ncbi:MAG: hypothetical protein P8P90_00655 [Opitutales bacterium]|nr:hypothetical protein [Opitutales bacterium]
MKHFLASLCLIIVGTLSVSVVSPGIHSYVFHGDAECPHSKAGKSCSSHQPNSSEDEQDAGSCVVVVFGKSVEHGFTSFDAFPVELLSVSLTHLESASKPAVGEDFTNQARGPPEKV